MARISRSGQPPLLLGALAMKTNLPAELLRSELDRFVAGQMLVRSREQGEPRYAIARDLDSITISDVTRLVETTAIAVGEGASEDRRTWQFVDDQLLRQKDEIAAMTLRQFSSLIDPLPDVIATNQPKESSGLDSPATSTSAVSSKTSEN
jgi:DNA-binding IscR family transcriptional regulator